MSAIGELASKAMERFRRVKEDRPETPLLSWSSILKRASVQDRRDMAFRHASQHISQWIDRVDQGMLQVNFSKLHALLSSYDALVTVREEAMQSDRAASPFRQAVNVAPIRRDEALAQFTALTVTYHRDAEETSTEDPGRQKLLEKLLEQFKKDTAALALKCMLCEVAFPEKYLTVTREIFDTLTYAVSMRVAITKDELVDTIQVMRNPEMPTPLLLEGFQLFSLAMTLREPVMYHIEQMRSQLPPGVWPSAGAVHRKMVQLTRPATPDKKRNVVSGPYPLNIKYSPEMFEVICQAASMAYLTQGISPARGLFSLSRPCVDYLYRAGIFTVDDAKN